MRGNQPGKNTKGGERPSRRSGAKIIALAKANQVMGSLKAYLIQPLWVTCAAQNLISLIFSFDLMFNLWFSVAVRTSGASTLVCFSKDTLKKNKKTNPVRYWGGPWENISRRRGWSDKSRRSPKALEVWKKLKNWKPAATAALIENRQHNIPYRGLLQGRDDVASITKSAA